MRSRLTLEHYLNGIQKGDKVILSQAITLIESRLASDLIVAEKLIEAILPMSGNAIRLGITGSPGVGKSTFIESFGKFLTDQYKNVAVLAIDPSSTKTKGSILGDKTRMDDLSKHPLAFIRPTASGSALGGVADRTREAILLCEAAGFKIIIIETVGVGQSEIAVRSMVDFFLLLMLAGAGDELQGIKKGIMEMADGIVITKADQDNKIRASQAQADFQHALHLFQLADSGWSPQVLISSAFERTGIQETWTMIEAHQKLIKSNGYFLKNRQDQNLLWFNECYELSLRSTLTKNHIKLKKELEKRIIENKITPIQASKVLVEKALAKLAKTST